VVSILLAFGIDAWWDGRQERDEEREILLGLQAEFVDLHARLVGLAEFNRQGIRRLEQFLSDTMPRLEARDVDAALYAATIVNVLDQGGALDALLASGRLELIQDRALRDRLAKWPDWLEDIHTNDLSGRDFAMREISPLLAGHGWPDVVCFRWQQCRPPGPATPAQVSMARDPQIRALLISRRGWMGGAVRDHADRAVEAEALLEMIAVQLSR
jgi:hypothetical protein